MSVSRRWANRFFGSKVECFAILGMLLLGMDAAATPGSLPNTALAGWVTVQRAQPLFYVRVPTGPPIGALSTGGDTTSFSLPAFEALRRDRRVFSDVMAFVPLGDGKITVQGPGRPEEATGEMVSANFFSGLGVKMRLGGGFKPEDEQRHTPFVVLSLAYWTHLYSRDPGVLGQAIYIHGVPFSILGVTNEEFTGVDPGRPTDFWIPLQNRPELEAWGNSQPMYGSPNWWYLRLIARLAPGVDAQRAVTEATPEFQQAAYMSLGEPTAGTQKVTFTLAAATGIRGLTDGYGEKRPLLAGLVVLLLLLACGYVALRNRKSRVARRASGVAAS